MKRTYRAYINDITAAIANISEFIEGMEFNDFIKEKKTEFAVIRALEIIGEATKISQILNVKSILKFHGNQ